MMGRSGKRDIRAALRCFFGGVPVKRRNRRLHAPVRWAEVDQTGLGRVALHITCIWTITLVTAIEAYVDRIHVTNGAKIASKIEGRLCPEIAPLRIVKWYENCHGERCKRYRPHR